MAEILNLDINLDQALQDATKLKTEIGLLRAQLKSLKDSGKENDAEFVELSAQLKVTTNSLRSQEAMIQKTIIANKAATGSLDQLKAQLSIITANWNKLSEQERLNTDAGKQLTAEKIRLTDQLKLEEAATGDARRNVGNYADTVLSARAEIKKLTAEIVQAKLAGNENSASVIAMKNRLGELKDTMSDVSNESKILGSDTKNLDLASGSMAALGSAAQVAQGSFALFGGESDELQESLQKMMITQTLLNNVSQVGNSLQKEAAFMMTVNAAKTKIVTAAQWLWNVAMTANPIGLLIAGVGALVAAVTILAVKMSSGSKETDKLNAKLKILEIQSKSAADFDEYYTKVLEAKGATDKEITDQMLRNNKDRQAALQKEVDIFTQLRLKQGVLDKDQAEAESKKYEELNKLSDEYNILQLKKEKQLKEAAEKLAEEEEAAEKERVETRIKNATLVFEQNKIKRDNNLKETSLDYDKLIALENSLYSQGAAIEKQRYNAGLVSRQEYNDALFKLDNERDNNILELNKKRAEESIASMNLEIEKFKNSYAEKNKVINENVIFNKDAEEQKLSDSIKYQQDLTIKQQELIKYQLDNKLINQSEYDAKYYESQVTLENSISELKKQYNDSEIERVKQVALTNAENEKAIYEDNINKKFELQQQANERSREEELRQAQKIGADTAKINEKYNKIQVKLELAKEQAKLDIVQSFAGNLAQIFGETTAIGKAAAVAQTTINTYASATAAYKSMVDAIKGPWGIVAGIAAAAASVAMGMANVKKILSVSTDLSSSSSGSSASSSSSAASDVTSLTSNMSSVNTSVGNGIVSRTTDGSTTDSSSSSTVVLVVDDVTKAQSIEANKVKASTI
jgi:hypothetical protein